MRAPTAPHLAICLIALIGSGCYSFAEPSYHPGDARDVLLALSRRGVTVSSSQAGGSACADPGLLGNALHLFVTVASDPVDRDVYLYTFRSKSWESSAAAVDACQAQYAASQPGVTIDRLDIPTYRVLGSGWSEELTQSLRDALAEAATQGD